MSESAQGLLIFDCDGVLVDSEPLANQIFARHLRRHQVPWSDQECLQRFQGRSLKSCFADIAAHGFSLPEDFEATLQVETFRAFERQLQPVVGVETALQALSQRRCIASSGGYDKLACSLGVTGLGRYFGEHVYSAVEVAAGKPAPDLFLYACQQMSTEAENCLVIEDSPAGVEAGIAAGMEVLWYDPFEQYVSSGSAVTRFASMAQLPELVAAWQQQLSAIR